QGDSGAHTAVSGATELYDDAEGSFAAYRVDGTAGTYSIGATSYTAPDLVAGVFHPAEEDLEEVDISPATLTLPALELSGTVEAPAASISTATLNLGALTLSGSLTVVPLPPKIEVQLFARDVLSGTGHDATSSSRNVTLGP